MQHVHRLILIMIIMINPQVWRMKVEKHLEAQGQTDEVTSSLTVHLISFRIDCSLSELVCLCLCGHLCLMVLFVDVT